MVDYAQITDDQINMAVWDIKGRPLFYAGCKAPWDYVHDDGETWRALVEMPWATLSSDGLACKWDMFWRNYPLDGEWHRVSRFNNPNRAVWIAWLQRKDSQKENK